MPKILNSNNLVRLILLKYNASFLSENELIIVRLCLRDLAINKCGYPVNAYISEGVWRPRDRYADYS